MRLWLSPQHALGLCFSISYGEICTFFPEKPLSEVEIRSVKAQRDYYQAIDKVIEERGGTLSWNMRC